MPNDPAATLYDNPASTAAPLPDNAPAAGNSLLSAEPEASEAGALYGPGDPLPELPIPDDIRAARQADQSRALYGAQGRYRGDIPDPEGEVEGMTAPMARAVTAELREMAHDVDASSADVRALSQAVAQAAKQAPSDEQRGAWRQEAQQLLRERYGERAGRVIEDARKLVAQDPRRAALLNANGIGDNPQVVLAVAEMAHRARTAGKLQ